MSKSFAIMALCCVCFRASAQKNINLIITIDEAVVSSVTDIKLMAISQNGTKRKVGVVDYYPGNLSVSEPDYVSLMDTAVATVFLIFDYAEFERNGEAHRYHYNIDVRKGWLTQYFYILNIYNTTKKKYRKLFFDEHKTGYVHEFIYPGGSTLQVRKR